MEISVDQYAVLHQHYDSVQAALSMSLLCEPIRQYFCSQHLNSIVVALLQHVVTRDSGNKKALVICEYCCWDQLYLYV